VLFIDDAQFLRPSLQKALVWMIEKSESVVLLATTHWGAIDTSLAHRFGDNVFELLCPAPDNIAATL
jgi:hypothetical protein